MLRTHIGSKVAEGLSASEISFHITSKDVDLGVCYPPQLIKPRSFNSNPIVVYLLKTPVPTNPKENDQF